MLVFCCLRSTVDLEFSEAKGLVMYVNVNHASNLIDR